MATHRKKYAAPTGSSAPSIADFNLAAAALLYDMAALQPTERSRFGYKRAAKAIAGFGPEAKAAIPHLRTLLNDQDPSTRSAAEAAIKSLKG